jgi:acyl-CoA synthetase (AMP-forming)/AMP-acid ligase II
MDMPRLSKSVRRVTVLQRDANGTVSPVVIFNRGRKKKKQTAIVKPFERFARSLVEAGDAVSGSYLKRHKKSNRKHRDGWIRDGAANLVRANAKGIKKLRLSQFLGL